MIRELIITLLLLTLAPGCGRSGTPSSVSVDLTGITERSELYREHAGEGWQYTSGCDSLLFSGLYAAAGADLDLTEAEIEPGHWIRKPLRYGECSPGVGTSRSTISRDGILGVFWWAWRTGNVAAAERLLVALRGNNYQLLGEGTLGELLLTPTYIHTLALIVHRLGSTMNVDKELNLRYLTWFGSGAKGFQRHIQIWHILLRGELQRSLSSNELDRIQEHVQEQPSNPLYHAAYARWYSGNQGRTVGLLEGQYPGDRLPGSEDYCPEWPIQRDNVTACPAEGKTHTGLDLVVIYRLILLGREGA